jgi:uncharacterized membrane protein (UPF0182 family)
MRAPSDLPRRPLRQRTGRGRVFLVVGVVVLFLVLTSLRGVAGFYTDYLWFESLGRGGVFKGVLGAKIALAVIFTLTFFVLMWVNLVIADRLAPPFRPSGPDEEFLERYHDLVAPRAGWVRAGVAVLLALIAGAGVSSEWNSWLLFTHGGKFGVKDPQFHTDIGFYVFKLPFLSFVSGWLFASLLIVLIVTAVAHYLNGGIRVSSMGQRVTPAVKAHLSVLLGLLALVKAGGYWLQRYELTLSNRGFVRGAGYTDVKAQLPAIHLLLLISIASFVLFIVNIWRRGWTLPVLGVGLWLLVALVAGAIYPQFVQRFQVTPNESSKERPYIERNIAATQAAMNLSKGTLSTKAFDLNTDVDKVDLAANEATVRNIRIWDPSASILGTTFPQLQRTRDYYAVNDVDIDRYDLDGEITQVVLSVRDLNSDNVPQKSWVGQHLSYTHGYGAIVAPANAKETTGQPVFVAKDVPYKTDEASLKLDQPAVYVGEKLGSYVLTNTKVKEIDYRGDTGTVSTEYKGDDGVKLGGFVKRAAFALRFGEPNFVLSKQLTSSSKVLYIRDIRDRVETLAPFLHFDADPYPVIIDGRIKWIVDAYTTTDRYPYAQTADNEQLDGDSGLNHGFNYVRNSAKAVVDAYDGSVTFYEMPGKDPILQAYRKAFPSLFTSYDKMPDDLKAHLRYPEDLFRVQTNMWGRYHVTNPQEFYGGDDQWDVARDPGTAGAGEGTRTTDANGQVVATRNQRIDPYYLYTKLPGDDQPEFVLLRPFVPVAKEDDNQVLRAFMVGQSDGDDYGQLKVYVMPPGTQVAGPALVQGAIQANTEVSQQETLLNGSGSTASYGTLSFVPIDGGLVYVRPFYVTSSESKVPGLEKVIVYFNGTVVIKDTLQEALTSVFGSSPNTREEGFGGTDANGGTTASGGGATVPPPPSGTALQQAARLLQEADALFQQADDALAAKDLAKYQDLTKQARQKTSDAEQVIAADASTPSSGASTTTTTSTTVPST